MNVIGLLIIAGGYLVGSLASAILTCRVMGLPDPRSGGSGNPGATNVLRLGGKKAALITLAGDCLKGFLPVLAASVASMPTEVVALTGLAAFFGHLFPVFFGFKGGKGVATALGVITGLSALAALGTIAVWLVVAATTRYSSLAALVAAGSAPVILAVIIPGWWYAGVVSIMTIMLFWRHRANIQRLRDGTESRIGQRAKSG